MLEKTVIAGLIGVFTTMGYAGIADQSEVILQEANVVAAVMQERALSNAVELYWLQEGVYPDVTDQALIVVLYDADLLTSTDVVYDVEYVASPSLQRYELSVS